MIMNPGGTIMRIYANEITEKEILDAALHARVSIERLRVRSSRQYARSFDVILSGSGARRSQYADRETPSATWDEWGIFLAQLFDHEPDLRAGPYRGRDHFGWSTDDRYGDLQPDDQHKLHRWEYRIHVPLTWHEQTCRCGAVRRFNA